MSLKNKIIFFISLILFFTSYIYSSTLQKIIKNKKWNTISSHFSDNSYLNLEKKFNDYLKITLIDIRDQKIRYFAKYIDRFEIGVINFKKVNGKFCCLKTRNYNTNSNFVRSFEKYNVKNRKIKIGDAEITFDNGVLYLAKPIKKLLFYKGIFTIKLLPKDIEEQKTLKYLYKTPAFFTSGKSCTMVLQNEFIDILLGKYRDKKLKFSDIDYIFLKKKLAAFQKEYGIWSKEFDEYYYTSFTGKVNVLTLKANESYYRYFYERKKSPDTILFDLQNTQKILSYNQYTGEKSPRLIPKKIKKIDLGIYLNPDKSKVWSTALLLFPESVSSGSFKLSKGIQIHDYFSEKKNPLNYVKQGDNVHIMGNNFEGFKFYYSGKIPKVKSDTRVIHTRNTNIYKTIDNYLVFDKRSGFYPDPGDQYFKSSLKISIPDSLNCLATGYLTNKKKMFERTVYEFKSDATKGIAIVCGKFNRLESIESIIPLKMFGSDRIKLTKIFKKEEVKNIFNFLIRLYGRRKIKELNILLKRWVNNGGISYPGFILFNIVKKRVSKKPNINIRIDHPRKLIFGVRKSDPIYEIDPLYFTDEINRDVLIHELAHQWWGGIISRETYREKWITEGGAQFSTLLYLESILTKKKFFELIKMIIEQVREDSAAGPIIYGKRIDDITGNHSTYKNLIYNKSALVFFMFREIIGKKNLFIRLNELFSKFSKKNISTRKFIYEITKNEEKKNYLKKFFTKWIHLRDIPLIEYSISTENKNAIITFKQKNTDFVFPLNIIIKTKDGVEKLSVVIKDKKQQILITNKNFIKKIRVENGYSPVYLKENRNLN